MSNYYLQKYTNLKNVDTYRYVPRFEKKQMKDTDDLAEELHRRSTLTVADVKAVLAAMTEYIAEEMANGSTLRIDKLGLLKPTLKMESYREVTPESTDETYIRTHNLYVNSVRLYPDKELLANINRDFAPTRSQLMGTVIPTSTDNAREERTEMLKEYLARHAYINVRAYMELTGLHHTKAVTELKDLAEGDEAILCATGRGSHKIYVLRS